MNPTLEIIGYRIIRPLGAGGMGDVYLAIQESLQRQVAIKIIRSNLVEDDAAVQRFLKEGAIIARLTHPHIVKVFNTGIHEGRLYLAMEYLDGGTLKDVMARGLPLAGKLDVIRTLLNALGYAHQQGIMHRDVKPQNILFYPQGKPVLSDFGIAKALAPDATNLTRTTTFIGSPRYMSPEQLRGEAIDHRVDLFAMGVLFYELLLEETIYSEVIDPFALALHQISDPVPQLPSHLSSFQPALNRLMAKNRDERFQDAASAISALDKSAREHSIISGSTTCVLHPISNERPSNISSSASPQKRNVSRTIMFGSFAIIGLAVIGGAGFYLTSSQPTETPATHSNDSLHRYTEITRIFLQATGLFEQGDYTSSLDAIDNGLRNWPNATALLDLRQALKTRIAELEQQETEELARERKQAIDDYHDHATTELEIMNFDESLSILEEGLSNWPDAEELSNLHAQVIQRRDEHLEQQREVEIERQHLAEEERRQAIKQIFEAAENQHTESDFEASLATLDEGLDQWPEADALVTLRSQIISEMEDRQHRNKVVEETIARIEEHESESNYPAALEQLDETLQDWPNDEELNTLRAQLIQRRDQYLEQQRQAELVRQQDIAHWLTEARARQEQSDYAGGIALLDTGLAQWPESSELQNMHNLLSEQLAEQMQRQADLERQRLAEEKRQQAIARLVDTAETQRSDENYEASLTTLDDGLAQWPDSDALASLRAQLVEELNEQRRLMAEIMSPEPTNEQSKRIDELLTRAEAQFNAQRLTTPAGNNAYETYNEILEIDTDNQYARKGLERIAQQYMAWAESNKQAKNYSRSLVFIERGLKVVPGHNALSSLQEEIVALRRQAISSPRIPTPSLPAPEQRRQTPTAERPPDNVKPTKQPAKEPLPITAPSITSPADSTFEEESSEEDRRPFRVRPFGTF